MLKKLPHTYIIVFMIIAFCAILTWIVPGGEYTKDASNNVIPNSYHQVESVPQTWEVLSAFFDGFVKQAEIICFVLIIGAAFWVLNATKSIDVGIYSFLKFTKKIEHYKLLKFFGVDNIIITLLMLLFSIFGAVFGMSEETIAFIIIFVPLAISMGYDSIVGVCMCFVAAGLGFAGAMLNPFTIGIAQGIAGIPLFSGIEYRFVCWIVINAVGIAYILRYAAKIKKDPTLSPVYKTDQVWRDKKESSKIEDNEAITYKSSWFVWGFLTVAIGIFAYLNPMTNISISKEATNFVPALPVLTGAFALAGILSLRKSTQVFILNLLIFTILFLIVGVMAYHWYVKEIATLFLVLGIASGVSMSYNGDKIVKLLLEGAKDIMSAALVVGLAGGIIIVLQNGKIIDTILYSVADSMNGMGKIASVSAMYVIQTFINIFIPSGSAKAALTMPIMSQLSDLINISRQSTVMAFQFGDGFTNMITPTSSVLLGVLGVAKIPYQVWFKWILPFMTILVLIGLLLLFPTVLMELNGF